MKKINTQTLLERLYRICEVNGYYCETDEPSVTFGELGSKRHSRKVIEYTEPDKIADRYRVFESYGGVDVMKYDGTLMEVAYDMGLLCRDELFALEDVMLSPHDILYRSERVRPRWKR
jgi:hypothetical protein